MDAKIKDQWCKSLRSGEYKQCALQLKTETGFCCLGVLTDLAVKAGVTSWQEVHATIPSIHEMLPNTVAVWAGIPIDDYSSQPTTNLSVAGDSLSGLNDQGRPFTQIADLIEEHL